MNPTVDGMMAAMGWIRDADRTAEEVAVYLRTVEERADSTDSTDGPMWKDELARLSQVPTTPPGVSDAEWHWVIYRARGCAPRWRVPAIRRRQAERRRAS